MGVGSIEPHAFSSLVGIVVIIMLLSRAKQRESGTVRNSKTNYLNTRNGENVYLLVFFFFCANNEKKSRAATVRPGMTDDGGGGGGGAIRSPCVHNNNNNNNYDGGGGAARSTHNRIIY